MSDDILEVQGLTVALPAGADREHAVSRVDLALRRNEILCIVGESGSGKSILSRAIMRLLPDPHVRAVAGKVLFEGMDLLEASPERMRALRGKQISMIFQEPMTALNPLMTIGRQIEEVIAVHGVLPKAQRRQRVIQQLAAVNLPEPKQLMHAYPHQLSGGQRQRAMIAMALVLEPAVLIADEPTTALDVTTQAQILTLIRSMRATRDMAVLFVTHDFGVVADIADRVAVMQQGCVVEFGDADQVLNEPAHAYTRSLIAAVPKLAPRARAVNDGPVILSTHTLGKAYQSSRGWFGAGRRVTALNEVTLSLKVGETLGVVGESGSGKSTLARCITRLIEPDTGAIRMRGTDLTQLPRPALRKFRRHIQMVFQDPYSALDPRQCARDAVAEGLIVHGASREDAVSRANRLLDLVGLGSQSGDRYPHEFSGGQRQRICVARALALEPEILIADEVVSALDVSVQAQVLRLLAEIKERLKLTMLFITHDLRVAAQVCDSIAVMRHGCVVEYGATSRVFLEPQHAYTRELLAAVPGRDWSVAQARAAMELEDRPAHIAHY